MNYSQLAKKITIDDDNFIETCAMLDFLIRLDERMEKRHKERKNEKNN
jgi:hypothetical protein